MAKPIAITGEWTAPELRRLAAASRHAGTGLPGGPAMTVSDAPLRDGGIEFR